MKVVPRELDRSSSFPIAEDEGRFCLPVIKGSREEKYYGRTHAAHCPECDAEVPVQNLLVGEIIYCPDCNAELEVLNVEQPEVALAPEVAEDWGE